MGSVTLEIEHRRAIAVQGEASYPRECHGLLVGHRNGRAKRVVDLVIIEEAPDFDFQAHHYQIPPTELNRVDEIARANKLEVLGSYHSFVDRPAKPSIYDCEKAKSALTYVIVSVWRGRAHELTAWTLSDDRTAFFQEEFRGS